MFTKTKVTVSAPGKIHLLGEHAVVFGRPALVATVNLRITVSISSSLHPKLDPKSLENEIRKVIEPIIKKALKLKKIPPYELAITSQLPIGTGLGSSAAMSAAYITALLSFLKVKWDLNLINELAFEAEKIFHGNPSGADNSTIVFGGLIWYRKEANDLKLIQQIPFSIPQKLAKNFVLINSGKPKQNTKDMVTMVRNLYDKKPGLVNRFLDYQEKLVKELLQAVKNADEEEIIRIIKEGEKNLEKIGVASKFAQRIIRKIEAIGGAAKICGAGASDGPTGVLLCYHPNPLVIQNIAQSSSLEYFKTNLGVEGLRKES